MSASTLEVQSQTKGPVDPGSRGPAMPLAIVDALKSVAGNPRGVRASFAKGYCVRGTYTPSGEAPQVTRSHTFTQPCSVVGRFSVGGGNPLVPDINKLVLRGFSFRLEANGESSDLLTESAPVHFARTLEQMLAFIQARIPTADGKPDADKLRAFSEANPETLNQARFIAARPLPGSFAGTTYWAVHSFPATNFDGKVRFIKFKVIPVGGEITFPDDEAKNLQADFLLDDLAHRIADGGVKFHLLAILDRPGDPTMDVTARWPDEDERSTVRLGTIEITAIDRSQSCDGAIFDPANLAEGIGEPPDEIFVARHAAYQISLARRTREIQSA
ncbi:catalase family peroxidase [Variovorax sp. Sphag1AA]|uniref:catalase family peroxidase n=1 Tax=Variovorax sp. Sphag1AA TaxID=2587027 RepID=UPI0016087E7E|nr:catalase family peroxidase [Variovorax sp. Sphag1AA]MBB3178132.1 catalase [Variovorax sp. Sphag1AA]